MEIKTADTDDDRVAVRNFLAQYIDDIAPDAVPSLRNDDLFRPLVPWMRDDSGDIVAAALTCRSQVAPGAAAFRKFGQPIHPAATQYLPVLDKHSELLVRILTSLAKGEPVMVLPDHAELTTQQAADFLGAFRPHLIKQLDGGQITYRTVGTHRRIDA